MITSYWASVPNTDVPLRQSLLRWPKGRREAVYAYMGRQMTEEIRDWIEARTAAYRAAYPGEKELRLWHEAAADLIAWQRSKAIEDAMAWVEAWEA